VSDDVRPRPTLSATRSDGHTLTTSEVAKIFEEAGLPRDKRSIERYCEQGKLDCFKDPDELRYFITQASTRRLIGHLMELKERHQRPIVDMPPQSVPTPDDMPRPPATGMHSDPGVKQRTPEKHDGKQAGESEEKLTAMEERIKELENENFLLEIDKRAKDKVLGMMREQMTQQLKVFTTEITKQSHRVGQLETEMRQLTAPAPDPWPTPNDRRRGDNETAI